MNRYWSPFLTVIFCVLFSLHTKGQDKDMIPGQLMIMLTHDSEAKDFNQISFSNQQNPIRLHHEQVLIDQLNLHLFTYDTNLVSPAVILNQVQKHPSVEIAQFNHRVDWRQIQATFPNDPDFANQWGLHNTGQNGGTPDADVDAPEAWDITTGGLSVLGDTLVAAVVDGGISLNHSDLELWKNHQEIPGNGIDDDNNGYIDDFDGWNAYGNNGNLPTDTHGSLVAGIISAKTDNGQGISGVNWNTKVMPVAGSSVSEAIVAIAYGYILKMRTLYNQTNGSEGAFVVVTNSSFGVNFGNPINFPIWCALYDSLGSQGILSVVSTMNISQDVDIVGDVPSACTSPWMIAVTNTTRDDLKNGGAAFGLTHVDLGAPGTSIYSTTSAGNYGFDTGTSFSSPFVSGAITLMYSVACPGFMIYYKNDPANGALKIRDFMYQSVDTIPSMLGITATGGRLNLHKSLLTMLDSCSTFSSDCLPPYNFQASQISDSSAHMAWSFADTATQAFRVRYKKAADTIWNTFTIPNDTSLTINGLMSCTKYEFQAEAICDSSLGISSGFFATLTFTTEGCCEPPSGIMPFAISDSQIVTNWNPVFGALEYSFSYRMLGDTIWIDSTVSDTFLQINDLLSCTEYEVRLMTICKDTMNGFSDTMLITTSGCGACLDNNYCDSQGGNTEFEWIEEISLGSLSNLSGNDDGYGNFTGTTFPFSIDSTYSLTLTPGYSSFAYDENWRIWIDFNQDGIFQENTEQVFTTQSAQNGLVNGQFTIPAGTQTGVTRMRISMQFGGFSGGTFPSPCGALPEGEVEDYCVMLSGSSVLTCDPPKGLMTISDSTMATLTWNGMPNDSQYIVQLHNISTGMVDTFMTVNDSFVVSGLNPCAQYEFKVRSFCDPFFSDFSGNVSFLTKGCGPCLDANYCDATSLSSADGWIREVAIDSISHISGDNQGYGFFQNIPFAFQRGEEYDFHLEAAYSTGAFNAYWQVFTDWNQDGSFDQLNERLFSSDLVNDSANGVFTVPADAQLGNTRMRVVMGTDSLINGCGEVSKGEVQDYCLEIRSGVGIEGVNEPSLLIYPNPASQFVRIESDQMIEKIRVINLQGKTLLNASQSEPKLIHDMDIGMISAGIYFIQVEIKGLYFTRKLIVE